MYVCMYVCVYAYVSADDVACPLGTDLAVFLVQRARAVGFRANVLRRAVARGSGVNDGIGSSMDLCESSRSYIFLAAGRSIHHQRYQKIGRTCCLKNDIAIGTSTNPLRF